MIEETLHAAHWWVEKIKTYNINVEAPSWLSHFEKVMTELLRAKYHNHWYKDDPSRGSGYRAISNEYSLDPILDKAAKAVSHSLPKNLARMVLTSDDRWLVMFVNPGEVIVRDKKFQEIAIYDKQNHIYSKSLLLATSRKKRHLADRDNTHNRTYSKSDDDTLQSLAGDAAADADTNETETKSDGEDKSGGDIDYRQLFLQNIHNAARRNKEKEIEAHVQAFKEEMRLNHYNNRYKFGPYDDDDKYWNKHKPPHAHKSSPKEACVAPKKNNPKQQQNEKQSQSPKHVQESEEEVKNENILHIMEKLPNLHNGYENRHRNTINIDTNHSNYGKHLKSILQSCTQALGSNKRKHKNGVKHKNGTTRNNKANYMISMNGEYPILFPMSYASPSPSPSPSPSISPNLSPTLHAQPDEANIIDHLKDFELHMNQSQQSEIVLNTNATTSIYDSPTPPMNDYFDDPIIAI
jgi:hypothetical protein